MTGHLHPLTILTEKIYDFFKPYGFEIVTGPEIVTTEDNFDSLNIPPDHPARKGFDTFYLKDSRTLRAHMTALYYQAMKDRHPPVRLLFPGRCFRNESTDATHNMIFHQMDVLVIDEKTNLGNLIATLQDLMKHLVGPDLEFRIRSSYFPFTEPSIELDIKRPGGDWLEMLGAGMVNPNVIKYYGLDPEKYQGLAVGMGLERILNVSCGVDDVRYTLSGDYRYLGQF
ncbi:MAG: phenylalanine--tRNA ligase subunit alpha [Candidatus Berkelbacteria bacterium]|nr:phenylalanine--tRNA ligase subunit alpha [Candidatus Berkelbacteria bacterium]